MLTDQYGSTWTYPVTIVIPTAVPDPLHLRTSTKTHTQLTVRRAHHLPYANDYQLQ